LSNLTRSAATPITPGNFPFILSILLPLIEVIGKKDALPILFALKWFTNFFATSSLSVTIFCSIPPKVISIAVSYFLSTEIKFAIIPCTPLFKSAFLSQSVNNNLTAFAYPSFSFSVSIKNFCLESFILSS